VRWSYTKDGSVVSGSDAAWVDQVTFTPQAAAGSLAVTPTTGFSSSGNVGGSFSPSSSQFTLTNPGGSPINWSAANSQSWLTLSATSGTLAAGASTTVTATIHSSAASLNPGSYNDTITFINFTNGVGNTSRPVALNVNGNFTVTFNSNGGGTPSPTSKTVTYGSTYGTLATVSRSGHLFNGWFTAASGGTLITPATTVTITANQTLFAQWTAVLAPVANSQNVSTDEDNAASITLSGSDPQGYPLTYTIVTPPANGTLSGTLPNLTYTPAQNYSGADTFTFRTNNGFVNSANATVSLTVNPVNDAPVFLGNPITLADASQGQPYNGQTLAAQATDPDAGDTLTFSKVSGPEWLSVAADGALSGTPPTDSSGLNSFTVRVTDTQSATADATLQITVAGLPLPWLASNIGTGNLAGSVLFGAGTFTQSGSGVIGGTSSRFYYTYQTLSGDGEIIARISALQNTGNSSRIGVMIRESLASNSREIFMGLAGSGNYRWSRRTATGGSTSTTNSSNGTVPNTWVRLVRSGNTITAFKSTNGTSWTTVGSTTNTNFGTNCLIGLAVGSGSNTTLNTSQFSNVSVTP
jgi:uncharacterized repeat protein (TIGR02543 family)